MDTDLWIPDRDERLSRTLAAIAAIIGTGWAILLAAQIPAALREGIGGVVAYLAVFGLGWVVYIGLLRRGFGTTSWKDPTALWWACISLNGLWALIFLLFASATAVGIAGLASSLALVALAVKGLRLERRRGQAAQPGVGADGASPRRSTP